MRFESASRVASQFGSGSEQGRKQTFYAIEPLADEGPPPMKVERAEWQNSLYDSGKGGKFRISERIRAVEKFV